MGIKKTAIRISVLALIMAAGVIAFLYFRYHKPSELPYYVPADAKSVVFINTKKLFVALQSQSSEKPDSGVIQKIKQFHYFKNISDPTDLGINLYSDLIAYSKDDMACVLFELNNEDVFENYIKTKVPAGTFSPITDKKDYKYVISLRDNFRLVWHAGIAVIMPVKGFKGAEFTEKEIASTIEAKPKNSIMEQPLFRVMFEKPGAVGTFYGSLDSKVMGNITFKKMAGSLFIEKGNFVTNGMIAVDGKTATDLNPVTFPETDTSSGIRLQVDFSDPDMNKLAGFYTELVMNTLHLKIPSESYSSNISELINDIKGPISIEYAGVRIANKTIISQNYDENFNSIEREEVITDTLQTCESFFAIKSHSNIKYLIESKIITPWFLYIDSSANPWLCKITNHFEHGRYFKRSKIYSGKNGNDILNFNVSMDNLINAFPAAANLSGIRKVSGVLTARNNGISAFTFNVSFNKSLFKTISELSGGE
ncbi:MAG: DUF4836 family protein [Bacteroidia bacterium]|nr:DUF4836 family protein [Bacteroidia bacterium]